MIEAIKSERMRFIGLESLENVSGIRVQDLKNERSMLSDKN